MIDPGALKTRLLVQAPVETPDGQGGVARTFTTLTTAWASVMPVNGRDAVEADAEGATMTYRIVMRGNFSLTRQHLLVDGTRTYRIAAIRDLEDRRFIAIDAELRVE